MPPSTPVVLRLPAPVDLLPFKPHIKTDEIMKRSDAWAREALASLYPSSKELENFLSGRAVIWLCLSYPSMDQDALLLFSQWNQYWFILDDHITYNSDAAPNQGKSLAHSFSSTITSWLRDGNAKKHPLLPEPIVNVWEHMSDSMAPGVKARFINGIEEMLEGFKDETALRSRESYSSEELLEARRKSSGIGWCITFIEHGLGIDLTADFLANPALACLPHLARDQTIYHNEILSFRKEYFSADMMNLVVFWSGGDLSHLQDSVDRAHAAATKVEKDFIARRDAILATELGQRQDIVAYVQELGYFMAGCLRYEYICPRYHGIGHVWNGSMSGMITLTPDRTIFHNETF